VSGAHEARTALLARAEATMRTQEDERCDGAVAAQRMLERERNRSRLRELRALVDGCLARLRAVDPGADLEPPPGQGPSEEG